MQSATPHAIWFSILLLLCPFALLSMILLPEGAILQLLAHVIFLGGGATVAKVFAPRDPFRTGS
jgi:hypothetical protein